jgi:hypothetical protein
MYKYFCIAPIIIQVHTYSQTIFQIQIPTCSHYHVNFLIFNWLLLSIGKIKIHAITISRLQAYAHLCMHTMTPSLHLRHNLTWYRYFVVCFWASNDIYVVTWYTIWSNSHQDTQLWADFRRRLMFLSLAKE